MNRVPRTTFIIILFLIAFVVRFSSVAVMRNMHDAPGRQMGADGVEFNLLGARLASGYGYSYDDHHITAFRAPGFPIFLALLYRSVGPNYPLIYISFCIVGALGCVFSYLLAEQVLVEPRLARLAGVISVFYFPQVYFATVYASENLFNVSLAASLWLFVRYVKNSAVGWLMFLPGFVLGYSILTRPFAVLLLPLMVWIVLSQSQNAIGHRFAMAAVLCIGALCIVLPWTIRNYYVFHRFVFVATNGGSTFYGGNNDVVLNQRSLLGGWISTGNLPGRPLIDAQPDEVSHDHMEWNLGLEWVHHHITALPILAVYKLTRYVLPETASGNKKFVILQWVVTAPVLLCVAIGGLATMKLRFYRSAAWYTVHAAMLASTASALLFWGSPRFRDAGACLLVLYATVGIDILIHRVKKARRQADSISSP